MPIIGGMIFLFAILTNKGLAVFIGKSVGRGLLFGSHILCDIVRITMSYFSVVFVLIVCWKWTMLIGKHSLEAVSCLKRLSMSCSQLGESACASMPLYVVSSILNRVCIEFISLMSFFILLIKSGIFSFSNASIW